MDVIVYHADCPDGFCAAFVANKKWPKAELFPATHGQYVPFERLRGKNVLVVDFSWKRPEIETLRDIVKSLVVLDHHKTAEAELKGLDYCTFDMKRSGAQMMWDYLHPEEWAMMRDKQLRSFRPWWVDYVADRDLWKFELRDSHAVNAYIMALPHTIDEWSSLENVGTNYASDRGIGCLLQVRHYVEKVCAQASNGVLDCYDVKIVNAAYPNISDVCNALCEHGAQIGLGWFVRGDGLMQFSLRSTGSIDVSKIAKRYGGGGHLNAAGFQVPIVEGLALLDGISHDGGYV